MGSLSDKIKCKTTREGFILTEDVKQFIKDLKEKLSWDKNNGNGAWLSLKYTLNDIDALAGVKLI